MSAFRKLLIGFACFILAITSFSMGMKAFQYRNQLLKERKERKETSVNSTFYLGDMESAMMPAQLGTGLAVIFALTGVVFLVGSAGGYLRSKQLAKTDET